MEKFKVEFKAFKIGELYTNTSICNTERVCSVAESNETAREYRVIDTDSVKMLKSKGEDSSTKSCNEYTNSKLLWN